MSQQGGGGGQMPPGYNPHAVGAAPSGQPDPTSRVMGLLPDANVGTGVALNTAGPGHLLNAKITTGLASDKPSGPKGSENIQKLWKTKVTLEGFEAIKPAEIGPDGQPIDVAAGLGLEDGEFEQTRQGVHGSKHAHRILHNQMPLPTEFMSPMNPNPTRLSKIYGENSDSSGGGGGNATYEQIHGAGMTILQNGVWYMGAMSEGMLGGLTPPNEFAQSRSVSKGKGGFGLG